MEIVLFALDAESVTWRRTEVNRWLLLPPLAAHLTVCVLLPWSPPPQLHDLAAHLIGR